jgi:hypothetical protein
MILTKEQIELYKDRVSAEHCNLIHDSDVDECEQCDWNGDCEERRNFLDTIADKDAQIEQLRAKVEVCREALKIAKKAMFDNGIYIGRNKVCKALEATERI